MKCDALKNTIAAFGITQLLLWAALPGAFAADAADADVGATKAKPCLSCHDVENFAGNDAKTLEDALQEIMSGELAHLPLPPTLTDADLAAIAAYLAEAANE